MSPLGGKTKEDTAGRSTRHRSTSMRAASSRPASCPAKDSRSAPCTSRWRCPPHARSRYVDRMSVDDLRREYPELADWDLTEVDVVDDGELLATIPEEIQDFIVANHFLEHIRGPDRHDRTHLGKLKPGGVLFYAVPDKRYTFDFRRPVTPLEHMVADHEQGPERSRRRTLRRVVPPGRSTTRRPGHARSEAFEEWVAAEARELEGAKYSIHMHVWTQAEFLQDDPPLPRALRRSLRHRGRRRVGDRVRRRPAQGGAPPPAPPVDRASPTGLAPMAAASRRRTSKLRGRRRSRQPAEQQLRRRRARP